MIPKFLRALSCTNEGAPPVWFMRQAGRYLPAYRSLREKYSFEEMAHRPELIAEVTRLPFQLFPFDAAILFSDILLILEAFGCSVRFKEGTGPIVQGSMKRISFENVAEKLSFVAEGIRWVKPELPVPLLGFAGAPFTVACYWLEGGSSIDFRQVKRVIYSDPLLLRNLLDQLTQATIQYLHMQIAAGVDAIQLFDTWASLLPLHLFQEFCLPFYRRILEALRPTRVPVILFCRGSSYFAPWIASVAPQGISIDAQGDLPSIRSVIPVNIALQGNLDPDLLFAPIPLVQAEVRRLLEQMSGDPGYILNLGHGILPLTPLDAVQAVLDCVWERSSATFEGVSS